MKRVYKVIYSSLSSMKKRRRFGAGAGGGDRWFMVILIEQFDNCAPPRIEGIATGSHGSQSCFSSWKSIASDEDDDADDQSVLPTRSDIFACCCSETVWYVAKLSTFLCPLNCFTWSGWTLLFSSVEMAVFRALWLDTFCPFTRRLVFCSGNTFAASDKMLPSRFLPIGRSVYHVGSVEKGIFARQPKNSGVSSPDIEVGRLLRNFSKIRTGQRAWPRISMAFGL